MLSVGLVLIAAVSLAAPALAAEPVTIEFHGAVNGARFECGRTYRGVGADMSAITAEDFRFYVHDVRLVDADGAEHLLELDQQTKWQIERTVLIDFENKTGDCYNGTAETNLEVRGTVDDAGPWKSLRFTFGVPFNRNHTDLARMPAPLNLTAMAWTWNAGRRFARLDVKSNANGFAIHLGSTGCMPNTTPTVIPTSCSSPNRTTVDLPDFDPAKNAVVVDLGSLLRSTRVDQNAPDTPGGCRSEPEDPDCAGIFSNLGLPFGDAPAAGQMFFEAGSREPR
jgi:uncharacterized repeat protein (TIGR04052 family)